MIGLAAAIVVARMRAHRGAIAKRGYSVGYSSCSVVVGNKQSKSTQDVCYLDFCGEGALENACT